MRRKICYRIIILFGIMLLLLSGCEKPESETDPVIIGNNINEINEILNMFVRSIKEKDEDLFTKTLHPDGAEIIAEEVSHNIEEIIGAETLWGAEITLYTQGVNINKNTAIAHTNLELYYLPYYVDFSYIKWDFALEELNNSWYIKAIEFREGEDFIDENDQREIDNIINEFVNAIRIKDSIKIESLVTADFSAGINMDKEMEYYSSGDIFLNDFYNEYNNMEFTSSAYTPFGYFYAENKDNVFVCGYVEFENDSYYTGANTGFRLIKDGSEWLIRELHYSHETDEI